MKKMNEALQRENLQRVNKVQTHKREKILDAHLQITQRNAQQKTERVVHDCMLRTQSILEREAKEHANHLVSQLLKVDAYNKSQRHKLMHTLRSLNCNLDLGLDLNLPLSAGRDGSPLKSLAKN